MINVFFYFTGHTVCALHTICAQLYHDSVKAVDKTMNEHACVPTKFYLQILVSQIWPMGHSLPTTIYGVSLLLYLFVNPPPPEYFSIAFR